MSYNHAFDLDWEVYEWQLIVVIVPLLPRGSADISPVPVVVIELLNVSFEVVYNSDDRTFGMVLCDGITALLTGMRK